MDRILKNTALKQPTIRLVRTTFKGRTVREFLFAVVFIPALMTIVWMSIFGGIALDQVVNKIGELGAKGLTDISLTLFHVYDALPFGSAISIISIVLILIFFITSSDLGSLVIDSIFIPIIVETEKRSRSYDWLLYFFI